MAAGGDEGKASGHLFVRWDWRDLLRMCKVGVHSVEAGGCVPLGGGNRVVRNVLGVVWRCGSATGGDRRAELR